MQPEITVVKASGKSEPFDGSKLEASLVRAGADKKLAEDLTEHISLEITDGMATSQIYKHALFLLHKRLRPAAVKYSLRRAIQELGPSGFPFEDYIGSVLKEKGYEVKTDEIVMGGCVSHEVDVVAWNENKLIMAEAKFHNEIGLKSDVKVALYVKARMDDLKEVMHDYGRPRHLDEGWLITNTKFTDTAIRYAECKGLKLIGWNYPKKGNLQEMIEDSGLHPLTCLTHLSGSQKRMLLSREIVLCRTLIEDPSILKSIGFSDAKAKLVYDEIKNLQ
jgi:hypothetical protein